MPDINIEEKKLIASYCKRLDNYCLLKVGIFAIASVFALADFVNAHMWLRLLYGACWVVFAFYIYFMIDTRKFTTRIRNHLK